MQESFRTRLMRWGFNFFPAFRRTGGKITFIADDLKTVRIEIPLNWKTRNYVGTIFGGSIYGTVDPIFMVMYIKLLGPAYVVWDKSAKIDYIKPGKSTLFAEFVVTDENLQTIRKKILDTGKAVETYHIDLYDQDNVICASVEKTLHFRKKNIV